MRVRSVNLYGCGDIKAKIPLGPSPQNQWHVSDDEADLVRRRVAPLVAEITGEPQRVRIDLRRTACVVVDMQNDFCSPGGWLDHIGVDIAPSCATEALGGALAGADF